MTRLDISLLGSFQVTTSDGRAMSIGSDKAQALLAYLALAPGRVYRRDALAALLWPETGEQRARQSLRQALYALRRAFNLLAPRSPLLETTRQHVRFVAEGHWLDVVAFTDLLDACQVHPHHNIETCFSCGERLQRAIDLYSGDLLAGLSLADSQPFEEWRLALQEELHGRALRAFRHLANSYERRREYERAVHCLQRELALEPWREEAHRQLMRVLAFSGRRAAAMAQYRTCCRVLAAELNTVPSAETTALYRQIEAGIAEPQRIAGPNPYKGLSAFSEADAADFYGREAFAGRLLLALQRPPEVAVPAVALVGPSGSGKSSLVHAGLLPRLRMSGGWAVVNLRPGALPFRRLVEALVPLYPGSEHNGATGRAALARALRFGERSLAEAVTRMPALLPGPGRPGAGAGRRLLIVVDAFEELYTLCADAACRRAFLDLLFGPVVGSSTSSLPYSVLFVLRADLLGQSLAYPGMDQVLRQGCLILGQMTREGMQQAIERPARARGVTYEPGLVTRLLDDVGREPGNLPLLQFTLTQLWEQQQAGRLTHEAYDEIGGVSGALTGYAEDVYAQLCPEEREAARRVFTRMVHPGQGIADARRPVTRTELGDGEWNLVRKLADARLVITGRDASGQETAEVVHEALIRAWGRLRAWLEADLAFHFWLQRLRAAIRQWELSGRDEGALLRGALLSEAEEWIARRAGDLSDAQRAFVAASVALRDRERAETDAQTRALARALRVAQSLRLAANARLALRDGNAELALALAWEANQVTDPPSESQRILSEAAYAPGTRRLFSGHTLGVECLALSPDGRAAISGSVDRTLILWDLEAGQMLGCFKGHDNAVCGVAFHPDGRTALSASADHTLILWDLATRQVVRRFNGHRGTVHSVALSPDGSAALSGSRDRTLILWDVASGNVIRRFEEHQEAVLCLAISPDGKTALSGSEDHSLILWDLASGAAIHHLAGYDGYPARSSPLRGHYGFIQDIVFLPDGDAALSVSEDQNAILWDLRCGEAMRSHTVSDMIFHSVDVSLDGRCALLGTLSGLVLLLDLPSGQVIQRMFGHHGRILATAFHPDGRSALSGAADGDLRLWDLDNGAEIRRTEYDDALIAAMSVDLSPDERWGLTGFFDGSLVLWDTASGAEIRRLAGHTESIFAGVRFRPDGRSAVSGSGDILADARDNTVRLWDLETGAETRRYEGHSDRVWDLALSPCGRYVLSAGHDGTVRLWDLNASPEESMGTILLDLQPQAARSVAFSPDGLTVLVGPARGSSSAPDYGLYLLDLETGRELRRFAGYGEVVTAIAISPDGRLALSGALDGTIHLWDMESGELVRRLEGHSGSVLRVLFGREGDIAVSGSQDNSVIVWDVATGKAMRRFFGHSSAVTDICLAQGGRAVISVGADRTVREWRIDATQDELLAWIRCNRYVPELTPEQRASYHIELPDRELP